ncbi:MAG TPA: glycosyltransferase family 2 protein [Pirellulales bacterium]|nr:glycosyltransferase family 2 protein [Pirellulales bacterium]
MDSPPFDCKPYSSQWYQQLRGLLGEAGCRRLGFYELPADFLLSVVIPVYNEAATICTLVERVKAAPMRKELILVDDGSSDGSPAILQQLQQENSDDPENRLVVLLHQQNQGKGAALRTGFASASGNVVLVQDADLEYDPSDYARLLQPIVENQADVVYGSRFLGDQPHRVLYFWHYVGNKLLTMLSNCFTNLNLTDMETCYKVFSRRALAEVLPSLRQNRFGIEPEITAKIARHQLRVFELSVSYSGRTYEQGKKIGWRDGVQALWCILRYGFAD